MSKKTKKSTPEAPPLKYDLGCGRNKTAPDFVGVDKYCDEADVKFDLFTFPWTFAKDDSASELVASHFLEHVPGPIRWHFMEECWRILKVGGTMRIACPNWKSERAYGDCTHVWPPVTAFFFFYLHKGWRDANRLTYGPYALKCNFDHNIGAAGIRAPWNQKSAEAQQYACTHILESYDDLWCNLVKRPLDYVATAP